MADFNSGRVWAAWATSGMSITQSDQVRIDKLCDEWRSKGLVATDRIGGWPGGFGYIDIKTLHDDELNMPRIVDNKIRNIFEKHQRLAQEQSGGNSYICSVDPYLHMGGLKNKICGMLMEVALNTVIFPRKFSIEELWEKYKIDYIAIHYAWARTYLFLPKEKLKELSDKADWDKVLAIVEKNKKPLAIYYSAKCFVDACVEADFGIRFSAQ